MAPSTVSEKSQFFLLCSVEHNKKNWAMIDSINGAKASAIIYSIVQTAKINNLRPYDYLELLLTELPKNITNEDTSYLEKLLPWNKDVQKQCKSLLKKS